MSDNNVSTVTTVETTVTTVANKELETYVKQHTNMSLFNFYLDDYTKLQVIKKLKQLGLNEKKGNISATIRTLLSYFADNKFDGILDDLANAIRHEYSIATSKTKRSSNL